MNATQVLVFYSVFAEQSVLGGLMLDNEAWDQIADRLCEGDFYRPDHRLIFRAIARLAETRQPFDVVTLGDKLERTHELNDAGGLTYLGALAHDTPSTANICAYANIVREQSILRQMQRVGLETLKIVAAPGDDIDEKLAAMQTLAMQVADQRGRQIAQPQLARALLPRFINDLDARHTSGGQISGVSTGFNDMDRVTTGLHAGDLVIVAGRPSMGKTTFAMNIAENAAIKYKVPVAVFSMEMTKEQTIERLIASLGRIDYQNIRTGTLSDDEWIAVTHVTSLISEAPLIIDDTPALSPMDLRARARRLKREHNLGLIVVDYLQLMQVPGKTENRATEISEISRSLKAMAKELHVPVIALSQLNRSLEQRQNKRPIMSDLRESGAIEQDADLILFIYRDEVYDKGSPDRGLAEIVIGKQRNGPTGTVYLTFRGQFLRFDNTTRRACDREASSSVKNKWDGGFDYESVSGGDQ